MKAFRGYVQGYNAQVVTTRGQIIVAAEIAPDGLDASQLDPMISAAERELEQAGIHERPEVVAGDAGYWSNEQIDRLRERGIVPLIAADAHKRDGPRPGRRGGPYAVHVKSARKRARRRVLLETPRDGRAGLRPDQGEPADRALHTQGAGRPSARNGA